MRLVTMSRSVCPGSTHTVFNSTHNPLHVRRNAQYPHQAIEKLFQVAAEHFGVAPPDLEVILAGSSEGIGADEAGARLASQELGEGHVRVQGSKDNQVASHAMCILHMHISQCV